MTGQAVAEQAEGMSATTSGQGWFGRNAWLLAGSWLIFLAFPLLAILSDNDAGAGVKVASTVLIGAFGAVYLDGFRRQHKRETSALFDPGGGDDGHTADDTADRVRHRPAGLTHFVALAVLAAALVLVAGVSAVGVMVFVVVFAVFHFSWPAVTAVFATGLGVTIIGPLLAGRLADLWSLALILAAVGGAAVLVRLFQGYQFDQAHLRTGLAIGDERTRVARDVHDVLGHSVTAAILKVELCQRLLEEVNADSEAGRARLEQCRVQLADLESISRGALAEIRSTVGGLRATNLADEVRAARTVLADADVDLLVTGDLAEIPDRHRPMLAWVVREAVTNVVRHANADRCHIELAPSPDGVLLRVTDNGVGLGASEEGNGLRGLRERVAASGARVQVEDATVRPPDGADATGIPDPGTRIEVLQ